MVSILGWFYFGCYGQPGHCLYSPGMRRPDIPWSVQDALSRLDGHLAPPFDKTPYVAVLSRLGGFEMSTLSWWDHTFDNRPGSNIIVFAPSMAVSSLGILQGLGVFFPQVWKGLPRITLPPE